MTSATPTKFSTAIADARIPLQAAILGLAIPVTLSLASLAFWPESYGRPGVVVISDIRLARTLGVELLLSATLGPWLWRQGWRPHRTATHAFEGRDVLRAIGLWVISMLACWFWAIVCMLATPDLTAGASHTKIVGNPSFAVIVPLSAINGVFEEFLWLGLGVAALRRFGAGVAGAISVFLRMLVHVYQGPIALVSILPIGIVFTTYYIHARRLWPVVLAHVLQDLVSLSLIAAGMSGSGAV